MPNVEPLNPLNKGSDPVDRVWVEYVRQKFGVELGRHECHLDLGQLTATQSEIELIKYVLVRDEAFRAGQPIIVYRGPLGTAFIVDGHTRARVVWDSGERTIAAILLTSPNVALDMEFAQIAENVGGGKRLHIGEVPVTDRVGYGSKAWKKRREELFRELHGERGHVK